MHRGVRSAGQRMIDPEARVAGQPSAGSAAPADVTIVVVRSALVPRATATPSHQSREAGREQHH